MTERGMTKLEKESPFSGRTAILGGTFNPVHVGHLRFALEAAHGLDLAKVELTPCAVPPHKPGTNLLPFDLRLSLLHAAVEGEPLLAVSHLEAELTPPSYTCNLLAAWTEIHRQTPVFVLGDEDFRCLDSWRDGLRLVELADLVVVPRAGQGERLFRQAVARFWPDAPVVEQDGLLVASCTQDRLCVFLPLPRLDISASHLRESWKRGDNLRFLVPDAVLHLLRTHRDELLKFWN